MTNNLKLSENFNLSEFTKTNWPFPNSPGPESVVNLQNLVVSVLQPLRDYLGVPIYVTSGYRSILLNKAVGGASNSQHLKGQAADIVVSGYDPLDLLGIIQKLNLPYDQVIAEFKNGKSWLHISHNSSENRRQALIYDGVKYLGV